MFILYGDSFYLSFTIIRHYLAKNRPKLLLTTESFYYIFLRGNTEKAEISGFMGGGIPVFQ
jgi:hypothetical protein